MRQLLSVSMESWKPAQNVERNVYSAEKKTYFHFQSEIGRQCEQPYLQLTLMIYTIL